MKVFHEIYKGLAGLWSLIIGLSITGKYFASRQVTIHYPRKTVDNLDTYRGHIELVPRDDDPSIPRCIACGACSRVCPSQCIYVDCPREPTQDELDNKRRAMEVAGRPVIGRLTKTPPPKKLKCKVPNAFRLDYTLCSLCGQCVRTCPVDSLRFSNNVYLAAYSRDEFDNMDLMERFRRQVIGSGGAPPNVPVGDENADQERVEQEKKNHGEEAPV